MVENGLFLVRVAPIGPIERILVYKNFFSSLTCNKAVALAAIKPLDRTALLGHRPFSAKASPTLWMALPASLSDVAATASF